MISAALLLAEMDDLTVTLFEEAHEMVHVEKEARHKDHVPLKETQDQTTALRARQSYIVYQNGATSEFEMCFPAICIGSQHLVAGGSNQNTVRIQHKEVLTPFYLWLLFSFRPSCAP